MKNARRFAKSVGIALLSLLTAGVICSGCGEESVNSSEEKTGLGQYSEYELFQAVPTMPKENTSYTQAIPVGDGDYLITVSEVELADYRDYLAVLEENGFTKKLDNGENGIDGFVYTAHYQKDDLLLIVSYITNFKKITITATEKTQLSEHLFYDPSYVADNRPGAKTTFSLIDLEKGGNSFLIQVKDGHFLLFDGGMAVDLPRLLDYLESLTPDGETPVIDAWFISHSHADHMGILEPLSKEKEYAQRICVESVYYDLPSDEQIREGGRGEGTSQALLISYIKTIPGYLHSTDGSATKLYHPRLGERYYYSDITIDIIYTMELDAPENWDTWNASSTIMMLTIEGQKILLTGDSDWSSQIVWSSMYNKDYFTVDIYQAPHHGINVYKQISSRLGDIKTVIYPTRAIGTQFAPASFIARKEQNEHLVSLAKEAVCYGEGTVVLTFPYEVGTYVTLPKLFEYAG